ncbi:P-loop NTPase fold protein [Paremcibacter congregatus]|uniref:P-loop NTPase fold protein n=1 Tax=Paremcibacter congregatus TaxID=2043170 RepID=UPI003A8D5B62
MGSGLSGLVFSLCYGLMGRKLYNNIEQNYISIDILAFVFLALIGIILLSTMMLTIQGFNTYTAENESFILSDEPIETSDQDLLGLSDQATKFADKIYNNGSSQSIVYGLDAPWGLGKTSFISLINSSWKSKTNEGTFTTKSMIFKFEPLNFSQVENLSDRFIEEVSSAITKVFTVPEMSLILGSYSRYLKGLSSISIFGFGIGFNGHKFGPPLKDRLSELLKSQKIKLIVVLDDLDRVSIQEAKQILYSMRSAFDLPNISFIVCYDSQNLYNSLDNQLKISAEARCSENSYAIANSDQGNSDNLLEFLEKLVQIKIPIFIESNNLAEYWRELVKQLQGRSGFNYEEGFILKITAIIEVMLGIKNEEQYNYYSDLFGGTNSSYRYTKIIRDPRKLKRLLNHFIFMDFHNVEHIHETDFLHLLLIYINYPHVFRHICHVEMNTTSGYFTDRDSESTGDKKEGPKTRAYNEFEQSLDDGVKYLLGKVFIETPIDADKYSPEERKMILARYSDGIKKYLTIIMQQVSLPEEAFPKFQLKLVDSVHKGDMTIEDFYQEHVDLRKNEQQAKLFWFNFANKIADNDIRGNYTREKANDVILKLIACMPKHSALELNELDIGLRNELPGRLLKLLEAVGWDFHADGGRNNSEENLRSLAHRILGLEAFEKEGIVDSLSDESRGILGLYDLMIFRLYVSPDRSGNYFNINKALQTYNGSSLETGGPAYITKSMRDLSQAVFRTFTRLFIEKELNIFAEIDTLTLDQMSGGRTEFIVSNLSSDKIDAEIEWTKTQLKAFISYQLGNAKIKSGIGCGYYDLEGNEDKNGIKKAFNDYLFNIVFNPKKSQNGHQHFLDYLLINSGSPFEYNSKRYLLKFDKYQDVLDPESFKNHINEHKKELISEIDSLIEKNRRITLEKHVVTYQDYKQDIIAFLENPEKHDMPPVDN